MSSDVLFIEIAVMKKGKLRRKNARSGSSTGCARQRWRERPERGPPLQPQAPWIPVAVMLFKLIISKN